MEVTFSEYIIQTGPGTKASEWRYDPLFSCLPMRCVKPETD